MKFTRRIFWIDSKVYKVSLLFIRWHCVTFLRFCIAVEILRVDQIFDFGDPWRRNPPFEHHFEINALKPLVSSNFLSAILGKTETETSVGAKERFDQVTSFGLNVGRELVITVHDFLVDSHGIVVVERRISGKHLENKDAQSPPIHIFVVTLRLDNFRRQVLRSATQSVCLVLNDFCEPKIGNFNVTFAINEQVFRFQISIRYVHAVQILESKQNFACKK